MSNKITIIGIIVLVVLAAGFVSVKSGSVETTNNILSGNQEAQIVELSVQNGQYVMNPSELKKNVPVRIEADVSSMPGCSKAVVISAFNARKNLNDEDNTLEFTPDKAGTFNIACAMNMYKGTFTVLENDGSNPVYVEQKLPTGSSCGMNGGGGCGCGG